MKRCLFLIPLSLGLTGCTGMVVQKAKLQHIKNLTVASLFAPERVPEVHGQGIFRKIDAEAYSQIAEDAIVAFEEAFEKLGWEINSAEDVVAAKAYASFKRPPNAPLVQGSAMNAFQPRYFTPTGMIPLWLGDEEKPSGRRLARSDRDSIIDLLRELRSHAGSLVQIRYCFRTFERERKERAVITASGAIQLVDNKGGVLYETPVPEGCGGKARSESRKSMELESENWTFDPLQREEYRALFKEASIAEAERLVALLPVTPK